MLDLSLYVCRDWLLCMRDGRGREKFTDAPLPADSMEDRSNDSSLSSLKRGRGGIAGGFRLDT
jgi:hypothetical protein